jgi:hypothetical protein
VLNVRLTPPCVVAVNRDEMSTPEVFENRRKISTALTVEESDLENVASVVLNDELAHEQRLVMTHVLEVTE